MLSQFVTNVLAFLILLFILRKYAWGALLRRIDERRQKIASEFEGIEQAKQEMERLKARYQESLGKIEEEARAKIQQAVADGCRVALEIEEGAREHARQNLEKTKEAVAQEVAKARVELRDQVVDLAIQATHKVMQQYLDEETDRKMIEAFIREVATLEGPGSFGAKGARSDG